MDEVRFNRKEKALIAKISSIFAVRQLTISLLLPFLSIYITGMENSTKTLAGLAFGVLNISQLAFMMPMAKLSDRWGRKQTTLLGLSFYFLGTLLSGFSINIYHIFFARLITGIGAIKGAAMAWLTDGVRTGRRNSALSYVGMVIGAVAILGFSFNSTIAGKIGINYLFFIAASGILILIVFISFNLNNFPNNDSFSIELKKENIATILKNPDLLRLNILGFIEHFSFAASFFIIPILLQKEMGDLHAMWKINAPMGITGTCFMFYFARRADKAGAINSLKAAIIFGIVGSLSLVCFDNLYAFAGAFIIIYSTHCILQAILPATVSKYPNHGVKGTAIGIFYTFEAVGASLGSLAGSWLQDQDHYKYCFWMLFLFFVAAFVLISGFRDYSPAGK